MRLLLAYNHLFLQEQIAISSISGRFRRTITFSFPDSQQQLGWFLMVYFKLIHKKEEQNQHIANNIQCCNISCDIVHIASWLLYYLCKKNKALEKSNNKSQLSATLKNQSPAFSSQLWLIAERFTQGSPLISSPGFPPPHTVRATFTAHGVPSNI